MGTIINLFLKIPPWIWLALILAICIMVIQILRLKRSINDQEKHLHHINKNLDYHQKSLKRELLKAIKKIGKRNT